MEVIKKTTMLANIDCQLLADYLCSAFSLNDKQALDAIKKLIIKISNEEVSDYETIYTFCDNPTDESSKSIVSSR